MLAIRRLLVPIDFSPASQLAVDYAIDVARRYAATIDLLHALDEAAFTSAYADGLVLERPGARERQTEEARQRLAEAAARCTEACVAAKWHLVEGRPARVIVREATSRGTDLIVMGTHGRQGLAHLALGSVAERVLRVAPCPVLVVRDTARAADLLAIGSAWGRKEPPPRP